jgi:alpha-L-fucosidase
LVADLAKAVRARGVRFGLYYSLYEWYNPLYNSDVAAYVDTHMLPQLKDAVARYAPAVIFTDGEWGHPSDTWRSPEFLAWLYNQGPNPDEVVVDDRWGSETRSAHGGYYTSEYGSTSAAAPRDPARKWEENQGMGRSFGWNRNEDIANYKSAADLIRMLVDIVSQGGNLLLDIGPTADGRIPVIMQERLLQIGEWLAVNGDAVYGTRPWRAAPGDAAVRYTAKGSDVYAIVKQWPGQDLTLKTPTLGKDTHVQLLGYSGDLAWKALSDGGLRITMPDPPADALPCRCAYAFKLTGVK